MFDEERYTLAIERILQIPDEKTVEEPFLSYFQKVAQFIAYVHEVFEREREGSLRKMTIEEFKEQQRILYEDILPKNYERSYGNPQYGVNQLGKDYGKILSYLYAEVRSMIVYAYEGRIFDLTILAELFLEIYNLFEWENQEGRLPHGEDIQKMIYSFKSDYSQVRIERRIGEQIDPSYDFALKIIMESDLTDLRYLYWFGEYISNNEIGTANHLNEMEEEKIQWMADTFTEGYRKGFINGNKDISKKKVVNIQYCLGFERVVKKAVENFKKMGLKTTLFRAGVNSSSKKGTHKTGYYGGIPNKQYEFDHKEDQALYLDRRLVNKKLEGLKNAYEKRKELAAVFGGPAVMEVFGEEPFAPVNKEEALAYSEKQQKIVVEYEGEAGKITNEYIKGEERSFTIIAYPVPEIGEDYPELFDEIVAINTLDYEKYEKIQQTIIDLLDESVFVEVKGMNNNRTDLKISLHPLKNPQKETGFENCVADVNIPVGEVFTSPLLEGTSGILHVSQVYLNELKYTDLKITLKDGMVTEYSCGNFPSLEENKKYIKDNLLHHHETLPLGEFAIGTNTRAYVAAKKYKIENKLPILIAEKMGPHFALGDTCFRFSEEVKTYNPDGKEMIAKENERSALRKESLNEAYFYCHTDITIPYDELGGLYGVKADGTKVPIIEKGRFVLKGCEELNEPFLQQ